MNSKYVVYIYGRILGMFEHFSDVSPNLIDRYIKEPHLYFPQLHMMNIDRLMKNLIMAERLSVLGNELYAEDESKLIFETGVPVAFQEDIITGRADEIRFHKMTIGERIKEGREKLSFTQEELANRANLKGGKNTIHRYENNAVIPKKDVIDALREVLGFIYL